MAAVPAKKAPAKKASKGFEETLWDTANQLRGSVESSEYKHVVLSLGKVRISRSFLPKLTR